MCHLTNGFVLQYTHYKDNNTHVSYFMNVANLVSQICFGHKLRFSKTSQHLASYVKRRNEEKVTLPSVV